MPRYEAPLPSPKRLRAGRRNPESGVATKKERLLPRRRVSESARGVLGCTPQRRRMRGTK
ncbi:MAG: hypothetical protein FJ110_17860 [Deltaproteobacteria bacterium]|nr:hypothetical protein [Deltaproteobacteria bacterium]